jgi:hypothetical protein
MFFVYFISQLLHAFVFTSAPPARSSVQHSLVPERLSVSNEEEAKGKEQQRPLPWHEKRWNRNFAFMFSSHAVALGMVILFNPLTLSIIIAYIHFLAFCTFCFCEVKKLQMASKVIRVAMDSFNLALMIIGTVGIRFAQLCNGVCCTWL